MKRVEKLHMKSKASGRSEILSKTNSKAFSFDSL